MMIRRTWGLAVGLSFLLAACRAAPGKGAGTAGSGSGQTVVAQVGGHAITLAELDQKAAGRLQSLEEQQYEIRRQTLDQMVSERLLENEAAARRLSREALIEKEIESKITRPSAAQVRTIYTQNPSQTAGRSFEELRPQIEQSLLDRSRAERGAAFLQELRARSGVRISLKQPRAELTIPANAPSQGPAGAPITVVEFLDYQCPYCQRAQEVVDQLLEQYKGKVRFVHRDYLLGKPRSLPAARAARCAAEQDRFWQYHHNLLATPGDLSDLDLQRRAGTLGLDVTRFTACAASDRYDREIEESSRSGSEVHVSGTPTFFVNGRRLVGAPQLDRFREMIDAELAGAP